MSRMAEHKQEAYENAIDSLARYKFMQFGYWAAIWVHLNQITDCKESNPFRQLVGLARQLQTKNQEEVQGSFLENIVEEG